MFRPSILIAGFVASTAHGQTSFTVGNTTVQVEVIAENLVVPWDMVFGPDGFIWFTQASGEVYRMDPNNGTLQLVHALADVHEYGFTAGLHSMAFHPDFATQPYVYLHYLISNTQSVIKRFLYDAGSNTFTTASDHLLSIPIAAGVSHNGSRIIVDDTGMFMISIGETMSASTSAQDPNTSHGKILRFAPDGSIPADNPVAGSYVYDWGHRNPQGLVKAPNGHIYNSAHGAGNDDEVNIVLPNRNYGWPSVLGLCNTAGEIAYCEANDVVEPIHEFTSEIVAPSGMDYFDHPSIPEWQNSLLVATLRGHELHQLRLDTSGEAVLVDNSFLGNYGRLRDVLVHPDGRIFVSTSNHDWAGSAVDGDDRILVLTGDAGTQMKENNEGRLGLYPNPATDQVRVDGAMRSVMLVDASGRVVARPVLVSQVFDVSTVPSGMYTVRGEDAEGRAYIARLAITAR